MYPDDLVKKLWDSVMGIFILLSFILTPFNLAFRDYRFKNVQYSSFLYVIDAVFILDIFINFISVYEDYNKNLRTEFKEIAKNYYKTWLLVDIFSIIPFDLIFIYQIPFLKLSDSYNRILKCLKFFYI